MCPQCAQLGHTQEDCTNDIHPNADKLVEQHQQKKAAAFQQKKQCQAAQQQNQAASGSGQSSQKAREAALQTACGNDEPYEYADDDWVDDTFTGGYLVVHTPVNASVDLVSFYSELARDISLPIVSFCSKLDLSLPFLIAAWALLLSVLTYSFDLQLLLMIVAPAFICASALALPGVVS
jgi:hypothetical protein